MQYVDMDETYHGQFNRGLQEGQGIYHFSHGDIYDGQWLDGLMHGRGLYSYPDGSEFFGEFFEGIKVNGKMKY